jgi:hypothetical protein
LLDSGPTNIRAQIEHQTELLQEETDLALEACFAKMRQKFDATACCSPEEHALEMRDAGGTLREIQKPSPEVRIPTSASVSDRFAGS